MNADDNLAHVFDRLRADIRLLSAEVDSTGKKLADIVESLAVVNDRLDQAATLVSIILRDWKKRGAE